MIQPGDVISHAQMNQAEGQYLQKGMNFKSPPRTSIFLMSRRRDAPYTDRIEEDGRVLIYEGHDIRPVPGGPDPKTVDQPLVNPDGRPTDNGKFFRVAKEAGVGGATAIVHVYEKLRTGIWVFNGSFQLVDAWVEKAGSRQVCRFRLRLVDVEVLGERDRREPSRVIPSEVKAEVWRRDDGKCRLCGSSENLHFDHIIPYSRGGTSFRAENIQILCAKHNLAKRNRIE